MYVKPQYIKTKIWLSASKGRVSYAISRLDVRDNEPNRKLVREALAYVA